MIWKRTDTSYEYGEGRPSRDKLGEKLLKLVCTQSRGTSVDRFNGLRGECSPLSPHPLNSEHREEML